MKKIIALLILLFIFLSVSAQYNDLIVTTKGDSIACQILEINDSEVIFKMKYTYKNIQTMMSLDKIKEFKYNVIQKGMHHYKPGTTFIIEKEKEYTIPPNTYYPISSETYTLKSLQNASDDELIYYRYKAQRLHKSGKTVTTVGGITIAASLLTAVVVDWGMAEVLLGFSALAGLGTMAVGIPINLKGKKRIERINSLDNKAVNDIGINIQPCAQYNLVTQNYQPGLKLNIRF